MAISQPYFYFYFKAYTMALCFKNYTAATPMGDSEPGDPIFDDVLVEMWLLGPQSFVVCQHKPEIHKKIYWC